jgi:hypothetical protein
MAVLSLQRLLAVMLLASIHVLAADNTPLTFDFVEKDLEENNGLGIAMAGRPYVPFTSTQSSGNVSCSGFTNTPIIIDSGTSQRIAAKRPACPPPPSLQTTNKPNLSSPTSFPLLVLAVPTPVCRLAA